MAIPPADHRIGGHFMQKPVWLRGIARRFSRNSAEIVADCAAFGGALWAGVVARFNVQREASSSSPRLTTIVALLVGLASISGIAPAFADSFYFTRTRAAADALQDATGLFLWNDATGAQSQIGGNGTFLRHATDGAMYVDGIAINASGTLYGFAMDSTSNAGLLPVDATNYGTANMRSRLVSINTSTGAITYVGNWLSGRHIGGAGFDGLGRLWGVDGVSGDIVQISPTTGAVIRAIPAGLPWLSDLDFASNGMGIVGYGGLLFRVFNPNSGWVADVSVNAQNSGFDGALPNPYAIAGVGFTSHLSARSGNPAASACRLNLGENRGYDELGHVNDPFFANPAIAFREANQYDPPTNPVYYYNGGPGDIARANGPALPSCFYDWGDAPDSYGTLQASSGAYHAITDIGPYLGAGMADFEQDGLPTADATGDNASGTSDEDGVVVPLLAAGETIDIEVTVGNVSAGTRLQGWIDWAGDGSFAEAGDQIFTDVAVAAGVNTLQIAVPATAVAGTSFARFRIADQSGLGPTGAAPSGEVEDYQVQIEQGVDLSITKTDGLSTYQTGGDVFYTIVVTNNGPADVIGAQVSDPLPVGITSASWTCGNVTGGGVCGAVSGTGGIDTTADLPAGASVTYTLTMGIPGSYSGTLTNTATVTAPDGVTDTNTANNTASDTNTMEPPPSSTACTPIRVIGNTTFSGAPLPFTGSVQKSGAPNGWNSGNPWSTLGGNYTFTWTFSQPVPANWIRFAVSDVGAASYQTTPARFTVSLGAGGTANLADFSFLPGWHSEFSDLNYSAGVMTYNPAGEVKQAGALQGNSTDTVTSITITTANVDNMDHIVNLLYVRPPCVTVSKVSEGGTGAFDVDMTNVVLANGTAVPATTLTTTAADTPVSSQIYYVGDTRTDLSLSETPTGGWYLEAMRCTDQNAANTGNSTVIGSFSTPTLTIPSANLRPEADIQCLVTNTDAQPGFGACTATMYLAQNNPTQLFRFDTSSNPFEVTPVGPVSGETYNAVALNPVDNFMYGIMSSAATDGTLARIGSDGSVRELGPITGMELNVVAAEFGPDGTYYAVSGSTLYHIDVTTRNATPLSLNPATSLSIQDLAWHNGLIYAAVQDGALVAIDPASGDVTTIGTSTGVTGAFGGMFGAPNGVFGSNNNGGFYRFDLTTGTATLISNLQGSSSNDGARCINAPLEFPVDVSITKTDGSLTYTPGANVTYTIVVSNAGPFGVAGALVSDPLPAGIDPATASWTCGTPVNGGVCGVASGSGAISNISVNLPVDASVTFELTMSVPAGFTGDLVNTVNVTTPSGSPDNNPANNSAADTDQQPAPALDLDKTGRLNDLDGDGLIDLGETISYTFIVTNTGNVTMTNVTPKDPLLENANISVSPGPVTLAPNGSATFTATYEPTQADIDAGEVTNTATGTGTPPSGPPIESPPDTVTVPPEQTPGLAFNKTGTLNDLDGDDLIDLGEAITYTFVATNNGNVTLTNVTPKDPLLENAGISVTPGPQTLGPGGSATFTATYHPTQADIDAGEVVNTATGTGTNPGGDPIESPPDSVTVPPDQTPRLTLDKTGRLNDLDGDGLIDLGETITYSFLVTNTGSVTMTNVTAKDPLLERNTISVTPGPQTLGPGGSVTFTATYTPNQDDIDAGSVTNTATGTGTPPSGPAIESPPDTVTVPPDQAPALTTDKIGTLNDLDGDGLIDPGETIDYSFIVTNTGKVTLTDVEPKDPLLDDADVSVTPGPQTLAPGDSATFTATYQPTQAEIDAGSVENTASATGRGPGGGQVQGPPDTVTIPPQEPSLSLRKTGRFNDADGNGYASVGDTLIYTFTASNDGGQTVEDVWPGDPGPTFNGQPAGGSMSDFEPGPIALAPGQRAAFTATYTLTAEDIVNAGAVPDGTVNSATLSGVTGGGVVVTSPDSTSVITMPAAAPGQITVTKVADLRRIYRGQQAPFTIRVTNNSPTTATDLVVVDTMPSGFRYVDGSASVNGVAVTPEVAGLRVRLTGLTVPGNGEIVIRLRMLALSSAGPGEHVNRALAEDSSGNPISNEAHATVEIMVEPVFDCGDIIGKVFDDKNRNGYQDEGELGLPGVRIATVNGWLVTTDVHGRFHVACAALPDQRIGSNFIMKVDTRTLPTGYRLTTENPRVVRLTAGKMTELNFGASIGRVVRLDLQDAAFEPGRIELREQWAEGLDQLIAFLAEEQSVLRLTYLEPGGDIELAEERLEHLSELIGERWRQTSGQYRLEIEMRVETGR